MGIDVMSLTGHGAKMVSLSGCASVPSRHAHDILFMLCALLGVSCQFPWSAVTSMLFLFLNPSWGWPFVLCWLLGPTAQIFFFLITLLSIWSLDR